MGQYQTKVVEDKIAGAILKSDIKTLAYLCMINPSPPIEVDTLHAEANKYIQADGSPEVTVSSSPSKISGMFTRIATTLKKKGGDSATPTTTESSETTDWAEQSVEEKEAAIQESYKPEEIKAVEHSVDASTFRVSGIPLICYAAQVDRAYAVRFLARICLPRAELNGGDAKGWTPLHHASASGALRVVTELLELGASPAIPTNLGLLPHQCATNPQIGRAVQQECRDRSRMPSSA
eukprot:TRINITY_DN2945_c0_g1_i10.p1 TRINITY_DN2945_c0_g1~~TRINITY_DN2945_c0_g1_i10.p1  ORF type:complete len:236 (+),score=40.20 TRINITY_DN2945_c0_g1_i10:103-810(+)